MLWPKLRKSHLAVAIMGCNCYTEPVHVAQVTPNAVFMAREMKDRLISVFGPGARRHEVTRPKEVYKKINDHFTNSKETFYDSYHKFVNK